MMGRDVTAKEMERENSFTLMDLFMKGNGKTINDMEMVSFQFQTTLTSRDIGIKTSSKTA